jgi:hypothetical protein
MRTHILCQWLLCSVVSQLGTGVVGQATEYDAKERKLLWKIKKFQGNHHCPFQQKATRSIISWLYGANRWY